MKKITILFLLTVFACTPRPEPVRIGGKIQGTYYKVIYYDAQHRNLKDSIEKLLHDFDLTASLWVKNSMISRINRNDTNVVLNRDFINLFQLSKKINALSDGAFDPAIGAIVDVWGFGNFERQDVNKHMIDSLLQFSHFDLLRIKDKRIIKKDKRTLFDFNAIAQGYSVDLVGAFLKGKGIDNFLVDIGGELLASGEKPGHRPWIVGIEKPVENASYGDALQTKIPIHNQAIATSGSYRKFYEKDGIKYSHTIDPSTGFPVTHNLLSATVIADNCATADAVATALMVMGTDKARKFSALHPEYGVYLISADSVSGKYSIFSNLNTKR